MNTRHPTWKNWKRKGAALIVVLAAIILLAAIVASLTIAMRMERQAAHYYSERARADLFAAEAVEAVKATIQSATAPTNGWVTMPGRIVSWPTNAPDTRTISELFSGIASATDTNSPDLNRYVLSEDEKTAILGENANNNAMRVAWIYVFKDGTRSTDISYTNTSPVIGRLAYWTDDESSRIDLNTAWKQRANVSLSHPSQVQLTALPGLSSSDADQLTAYALTNFFNSPDDARRVSPNLAATLSSNRFLTTHHSVTPQLNPWGEPKIYLTTQVSRLPAALQELARTNRAEASKYFLDILLDDTKDPGQGGSPSNLDDAKMSYQILRIRDLLMRTNWPYQSGSSFAQKFKPFDQTRIVQLALDIIDYVRSSESINAIISPTRVVWSGTNLTIINPFTTNCFVGTTRHPVLTELGAAIDDTSVTNHPLQWPFKFFAELYLPPNYGLSSCSLASSSMTVSVDFAAGTNNISAQTNIPAVTSQSSIGPGQYVRLMSTYVTTNAATNLASARPTQIRIRAAIAINNTNIEFSPAVNVDRVTIPVNALGTYSNISVNNFADVNTAEVDDPRVNRSVADWKVRASGNTLGAVNSIYGNGMSAAIFPPPDGAAAADSLHMAPPKGVSNSYGIASLSELGYVTTGVESTRAVTNSSVPWRTLHLRPTAGTPSTPPDWALLDLFEIPVYPTNSPYPSAQYYPTTNSVLGRLNLNLSALQPFANANAARSNVLQAIVTNTALLANVQNRVKAASGVLYGDTNSYPSVGELAEISGIGDVNNESSETNLRGIVDLATIRGNVFRVYAVGQSLQQTTSGKIIIQAEKSVIAIVERTSSGGTRTVYWKVLPF